MGAVTACSRDCSRHRGRRSPMEGTARRGSRVIEPLLTAREVAGLLGLSPHTVLDWFEAGRLPGFRLGGRTGGPVRFRESEVVARLEEWRGPTGGSLGSPASGLTPAQPIFRWLPVPVSGGRRREREEDARRVVRAGAFRWNRHAELLRTDESAFVELERLTEAGAEEVGARADPRVDRLPDRCRRGPPSGRGASPVRARARAVRVTMWKPWRSVSPLPNVGAVA